MLLVLSGGVVQADWGLHIQGAGNIRGVIHALDRTTQTSIARSTKRKRWVDGAKENVNTREVKVSGKKVRANKCAI